MDANQLAVVQGMRKTRLTLRRWNRDPWTVFRGWILVSLGVAMALLAAVWVVASLTQPDASGVHYAGVTRPSDAGDVGRILFGNSLVLALHALACVAGFIAGSSLPVVAQGHSGIWRKIHDIAGPVAMVWVGAATLFSLTTQAYVLGSRASTLSAQFGLSPAELLLAILPHALPELTALFLPLAAWMLASRRGAWDELLAATFATVAVAAPVLVISAFVEVYLTPRVLLGMI